MLENKTDRIKYKFGLGEIDLKDYIHNIDTNVQNYLNFKNWNEGQKLEFMDSYNNLLAGLNDLLVNNTNRFSSDSFGRILDSLGKFVSYQDNDDIDPKGSQYYYDNNGNRITTDDYNLLKDDLKKNYKTFLANKEVEAYFNIIGNSIRQHLNRNNLKSSLNVSNKFDLNKNGFMAYWQNKNNPNNNPNFDYSPYINMDKYNKDTGKRDISNRASYLVELLQDYIKNNDFQKYDFSESPFKTRENYESSLNNAIEKLKNNIWDNNDLIALNQAGISGNLIDYLLTTEENPNITNVLKQALEEQEKRKLEEEKQKEIEKKKKEFVDSLYSIYQNSHPLYDMNNRFRVTNINDWRTNEGLFNKEKFNNSFGDVSEEYIDNIFNLYIMNPWTEDKKEHAKIFEALVNKGWAKLISNNPQLQGMYYIPSLSDSIYNRALVYNPINGELFYTFVGDIPELWNQITYNYKVNNNLIDPADKYSFKDGGILNFLLGGGFSMGRLIKEEIKKDLLERAKSNNRTEELQASLERKPLAEKTFSEPNNEFTSAEIARIASAEADIVSMISSFAPGAGTVVSGIAGLGSTVGSLYADVVLDGLDWGDVKNLGTNVGMDLLGLIPGGGAASKTTKILKNIGKLLPKVLAGIGIASTLTNGDLIINSINKAILNPKNLTVEDWQNIALGLGTVTGFTGGVARHYNRGNLNKLAKPQEVSDKIALLFKKQDGSIETRVFAGEDAKIIKEARDRKDLDAIKNATINKYDDLKDLELNVDNKLGVRSPIKGWKLRDPIYKSDKIRTGIVYHDVNNQDFADFGIFKADVMNSNLKQPGKTILEVDNEIINNALSPLKAASDRDANLINTIVPNYKQRLDRFNRNFRSSSDVLADINSHNTKLTEKRNRNSQIKVDKQTIDSKKIELSKVLDEINRIDFDMLTANFGQKMLLMKLKKLYLDLLASLTLEINTINNRVNSNKSLNKGINKKKLVELLNELKTSQRVDKIKDLLQLDINKYSAPDYKTLERIAFELTHTPDADGKVTITDPTTGRAVNIVLNDTYKKLGIKYKKGGQISNIQKCEVGTKLLNFANNLLSNPTITYGLPRAFYADSINREMTDLAKSIPLLKNPIKLLNRYVKSDLDSEIRGEQNYAKLRSLANTPFTSDASLLKAFLFESELKGQDFLNLGNMLSNQVLKQYGELDWQQEKENLANLYETAIYNDTQRWTNNLDNKKFKLAYLSKKHNIWDILGQLIELEQKQDLLKSEAIKDTINKLDISIAVKYDPNKYGANLTNEELGVWLLLMSGILPSSLDYNLLSSARFKVDLATQDLLRDYYNIPETKWSLARKYQQQKSTTISPTFTPYLAYSDKKGGKLNNNLEDIKRFQKLIKESIERNDKAINRLSKTMYNKNKKLK